MTVLDQQMIEAHNLTKKVTILIKQDTDAESPRTAWDNLGTMACFHRRYNLGDEDGAEKLENALHEALTSVLAKRRLAAAAQGYTAADVTLPCPCCCGANPDCSTCEGYAAIDNPYYVHSGNLPEALEVYEKFEHLVPEPQRLIRLPLYLFDHSSLTISTGPFGCRWDSGQVGWIFMTYQTAFENWGWQCMSYQRGERVFQCLQSEVEEFDIYLRGNVWGFEAYLHEDDDEDPEDGELLDSCWGFYGDPDEPKQNGMAEHWADEWKDAERRVIYG